jgi:hypothetical protein
MSTKVFSPFGDPLAQHGEASDVDALVAKVRASEFEIARVALERGYDVLVATFGDGGGLDVMAWTRALLVHSLVAGGGRPREVIEAVRSFEGGIAVVALDQGKAAVLFRMSARRSRGKAAAG